MLKSMLVQIKELIEQVRKLVITIKRSQTSLSNTCHILGQFHLIACPTDEKKEIRKALSQLSLENVVIK